MVQSIHDANALADLIEKLDKASHGDRNLDLQIEYCAGVAFEERTDIARLLVEEGFSWETVSQALDDHVPPYTASLDAALPGENIVFMVKSERRGKWGAVHRTAEGRDFLRWGATECIARRLAALAGRQGEERQDRWASSADGGETGAADDEPRNWKVMF